MTETDEDSGNDLCKTFEGDPLKDLPARQRGGAMSTNNEKDDRRGSNTGNGGK